MDKPFTDTINSLINKLLKLLFPKSLKFFFDSGVYHGEKLGITKGRNDVNYREEINLKAMLQEPVICFGNEWTDPIIGFGNYIEYITLSKNPVLVVNDILTGDERWCVGYVIKLITPELLDLILDLNPYQRWNLFSSGLANVSYNKPKLNETILSKEEILKIVEEHELWD